MRGDLFVVHFEPFRSCYRRRACKHNVDPRRHRRQLGVACRDSVKATPPRCYTFPHRFIPAGFHLGDGVSLIWVANDIPHEQSGEVGTRVHLLADYLE